MSAVTDQDNSNIAQKLSGSDERTNKNMENPLQKSFHVNNTIAAPKSHENLPLYEYVILPSS